MEATTLYTLIGYLGSAFVVASLAMRSILKLRLIGLAGAVTFVVYGYLIGAWPIVWTNVVIVLIHLSAYTISLFLHFTAHNTLSTASININIIIIGIFAMIIRSVAII